MAFSTNDLRNGMTLDLPEGLFTVVEFQHVKPGKGGAFVRTKLRNARTKAVIERTFRGGEPVEQAVIDKREMQYLYSDSQEYVFMDNVSYDQLHVSEASLGDAAPVPQRGRLGGHADVRQRDRGGRPARRGRAHRRPIPSPGCKATGCPAPASRRRSRRGSWSRCRCLSTRASASRSTLGPVSTSPGPEGSSRRTLPGARRRARERALELLYEAESKDLAPLSCSPSCRSRPRNMPPSWCSGWNDAPRR